MNDKELLELAAKAVGIKHSGTWNPLKDDGDAFRLAVQLNLTCYFGMSRAEIKLGSIFIEELTSGSEQKYGDPLLYARRAIVCAAAEIGNRMK